MQWTPFRLGRRADLLAAVSRASGVAVIAATGLHQAAHYDDPVAVRAMRPGLAGPPLELQLAAADLASGGKTGRPELLADQLSLIMEDT